MDKEINILRLLSNDIRLRIVMLLVVKDLCVCEIQGILNMPQYLISKHLKLLKTANILNSYKIDKYVYYSLNKKSDILQPIIEYFIDKSEEFSILKKDQLLLHDNIKNNTFTCK